MEGNNQTGCLLVHGFTGSPAEMEPLGNYLNKRGYTVYAPLLSGHGTSPEDLAVTTKEQIVDSAMRSFDKLENCAHVFVIGLSMGGLLSGLISLEKPVSGLVLMGTPVYLTKRTAYLAPVFKYFKSYVPKISNLEYPVTPWTYDKTPVSAVAELLKIRHEFLINLNKITVPTLVVQGMKDKTVRTESGQYIYKRLQGEFKRLLELKRSKHIVTLDIERTSLYQEVERFLSHLW